MSTHSRRYLLLAVLLCPVLTGVKKCGQEEAVKPVKPIPPEMDVELLFDADSKSAVIGQEVEFEVRLSRSYKNGATPPPGLPAISSYRLEFDDSSSLHTRIVLAGSKRVDVPFTPAKAVDLWTVKCATVGTDHLRFSSLGESFIWAETTAEIECKAATAAPSRIVAGVITPGGADARLFTDAVDILLSDPAFTTEETCRLDQDAMSKDGVAVLVGEDCSGTGFYDPGNGGLSVSTDRRSTWVDIDTPDGEVGPFMRVDHDGTRFILEANDAFYAFDGADLSRMSSPAGATHNCFACTDDGVCLSSNWNGGGTLRSTDGAGWETVAGTPPFMFTSIAEGAGRFVAYDGNSNSLVFSDDEGVTWDIGTIPGFGSFSDIDFDGSRFVAASNDRLLYSDDGSSWVEATVTTAGGPMFLGRVTYLEDEQIWVAAAYDRLLYSTDGALTWMDLPGIAPGHSFFFVAAL